MRRTRSAPIISHHPSILRGADGDPNPRQPGAAITPPTLLTVELEDFIPRFLARAADATHYSQLLTNDIPARGDDNSWQLHPPLHRLAHLAIIEVGCSAPGEPPVDPRRIRSAGMVIRRVINGIEHRWVKRDGKVVGWVAHSEAQRDDDDVYEPDPVRRAQRLDDPTRRLLMLAGDLRDDGLEEVTSPCFPAPPVVGSATKRTLVFGDIPTASVECSTPDPQPPFADAFIISAIPAWLRSNPKTPSPALPYTVTATDDTKTWHSHVQAFHREVLWLLQGTGLSDETPSAAALRTALAQLRVGFDENNNGVIERTQPLTEFLTRVQAVMLDRDASSAPLRLPDQWPQIADDRELQQKIVACFTARWQAMSPAIGRYEDPDARYVIRVFVRIGGECGCVERIRWSQATELCTILPWFAGSPRPPQRITLPDIGDLKKMTPNVSFAIPPSLRALLDGIDMKGLIDGKKGSSFGEWGMICSFSIPIITLCAFIILYIFLGLLNIVFQWMMWVKICIPYPKKL